MKRNYDVPAWMYDGYLMVQTCEGTGLRRGLCTLETPKNIAERLDPAMADQLARQGIRFVILSGLIGGPPSEYRIQVERNKPLAKALKAKGIKRVFYANTIGTIYYEPVFAEVPGSTDWPQRLATGQKPIYYNQWFRYIPCINNDHFMAYLKAMIREAMVELDLDGIFTDNYGYYSYSCQCEHCTKKFRDYLNQKYPTPEARQSRFEFTSPLDYVVPPPFTHTLGTRTGHTLIPEGQQVLDAVSQEWIRFRTERVGQVAAELNAVIKECNPNAAFFVNYVYGGAPGINCSVFHGIWPETVYPNSDLISAEVAGPPSVNEHGVISGRNTLMKVAKNFGLPLSTCTIDRPLSAFKRIYLAEGFAFNTAPVDLVGDIRRDEPPAWMRAYVAFDQKHRSLLAGGKTVADVAVLHNFESLSYCTAYPQERLVLAEQSLIQGNVTFDILFDKDLEARLADYPCLVLANMVAMRQEVLEKIAAYVRAGGAVIATDDTAILNERMLPWRGEWIQHNVKTHKLAELLGVAWPKEGLTCRQIGKGRVTLIAQIQRPWSKDATRSEADQTTGASPLIQGGHSIGPAMPMLLGTPKLAINHAEIMQAVDYVLEGKRAIRIAGPGPLVGEVTQNRNGLLVHLLNWNEETPAANVKVSVNIPKGMTAKSAELLSPDKETKPGKLEFKTVNGRVEFTVSHLVCYNLIVLR